jgi:hypothetical protein
MGRRLAARVQGRLLACERAGVEPRFEDFEGDDAAALALVIDLNSERRDLTKSQQAIVAARTLLAMPERRGGNHREQSGEILVRSRRPQYRSLQVTVPRRMRGRPLRQHHVTPAEANGPRSASPGT